MKADGNSDRKMMNDAEDDILIKNFLDGDAESFNILYERYRKQLYSYLNRLLGGQSALADDIFQQTWLKVIDQLPRYRSSGKKTLAWLITIAHNLAMDHFRRNRKSSGDLTGDVAELEASMVCDDASEPWRDMHRSELEQALNSALDELSPEFREVFLLRQDDVPFKDIAEIQECSINTVLARMQYALKKMRRCLAEWQNAGRNGV